ncbi:MAG: hypothetical protein ACXVAG_07760 [Vulcanimicrobiaceae bacterium]
MRALLFVSALACLFSVPIGAVNATGTARVQQRDGTVKIYRYVWIRIADKRMSITSSDGKGTLVISKAACSMVGKLMRCFPYSVVLDQNGGTRQIAMQTGTVWLNPSSAKQQLPQSSTQLPPRSVLLSIRTKAGTYLSLNGTVDELKR